jgi:Ca2+-binding EF-hand superfamily protein
MIVLCLSVFRRAQEIETVLKANSQVARQFIEEIDTDGDGTVSYGEFLAMWRKIEQNETDKNTPRE